jgi:hypothetical protein
VGITPRASGFPEFGADEGLIDFDNTAFTAHRGFAAKGFHGFADAVAKKPCGLHAAAQSPMKLAGTDALFAAAHHIDGLEPVTQWHMAGLENGAHADGERLPAGIALIQTGPGGFALEFPNTHGAFAVRANRTIGPQLCFDVSESGFFAMELFGGKGRFHGGLLPERQPNQEHWVCQV